MQMYTEKDVNPCILENKKIVILGYGSQGQTIHESNSDFAESMKKYIKDELDHGKTKEEIFASLVEKYGQWIIYDPGISKNTLLLWALPLLLFLIGGAIIGKRIFKKI